MKKMHTLLLAIGMMAITLTACKKETPQPINTPVQNGNTCNVTCTNSAGANNYCHCEQYQEWYKGDGTAPIIVKYSLKSVLGSDTAIVNTDADTLQSGSIYALNTAGITTTDTINHSYMVRVTSDLSAAPSIGQSIANNVSFYTSAQGGVYSNTNNVSFVITGFEEVGRHYNNVDYAGHEVKFYLVHCILKYTDTSDGKEYIYEFDSLFSYYN